VSLNPDATSMVYLVCVVLCVLAQLINSAAQPAAILLRKRGVVDFIVGNLPFVLNSSNLCNPLLRLEILHLPSTSFAAVIGTLFNQFLGGHSVKRDNCPIGLGVYQPAMPHIRPGLNSA